MWALLAFASLAAGPGERATFIFELRGVPVGVVELRLRGSSYSYRSRQLFTRGEAASEQERAVELDLDARLRLRGREEMPASLWALRMPSEGCLRGRDELTGREGELCATAAREGWLSGSMLGAPFRAEYRGGRLSELVLPDSRFVRSEPARLPRPPDLFDDGFSIEGEAGRLGLSGGGSEHEPRKLPGGEFRDLSEANALAQEVHRALSEEQRRAGAPLGEGSCLVHARRYAQRAAERGLGAAVVLGVVAEGRRGFPHAWVRVTVGGRPAEVDPTLLVEVTPRSHLTLGLEGEAGPALLDLLCGRRHLERGR
ncbi:MAG: transglutaminase domain-containing protein [Myxococcales bacterium]|nr:transglutaminase domain-containing protein [Myxococcales bacterium]